MSPAAARVLSFVSDPSKRNRFKGWVESLEDRRLLSAGTLNADLALSLGVPALTLSLDGDVRTVHAEVIYVNRNAANPGTYAGLPNAGDTVPTFCIELNQGLANGANITYDVNDLSASSLSSAQIQHLRELYGRFLPSASADDNQVAAFQCAIWEVTEDTDMNMSTGRFHLTSATDNSIIQEAQGYLNALNGAGPFATLQTLNNPDRQDLILQQPGTSPAYLPSSLSGHVYYDVDNNGLFQTSQGDTPIPGTTVALTGLDIFGNPVSMTAQTDSSGSYVFAGLQPAGPGGYTLTETQPGAYQDGKDSIGTQGGLTGNDVFSQIPLVAGQNGTDNDFGEVLSSPCVGLPSQTQNHVSAPKPTHITHKKPAHKAHKPKAHHKVA